VDWTSRFPFKRVVWIALDIVVSCGTVNSRNEQSSDGTTACNGPRLARMPRSFAAKGREIVAALRAYTRSWCTRTTAILRASAETQDASAAETVLRQLVGSDDMSRHPVCWAGLIGVLWIVAARAALTAGTVLGEDI